MNRMESTAPILLFVFSRPEHTEETLRYLAKNDLASKSDLIVYADGPRNEMDQVQTEKVRSLFKNLKGFRSVKLVKRSVNYGLAKNIIEGVTEVCKTHGRVIVLEDDLKTSPGFLNYMNSALKKYEDDQKVWHVSGWSYPINLKISEDAYFSGVMNCWGWATWANRWVHFRKDPVNINSFKKSEIKDFDLNTGGVFWNQLLYNKINIINTWAIYWYATIYKNKGLCVNPCRTLIENIGLDGSGTNSGSNYKEFYSELNPKIVFKLPSEITENLDARNQIIRFYELLKPSNIVRVKSQLAYWFYYMKFIMRGRQ